MWKRCKERNLATRYLFWMRKGNGGQGTGVTRISFNSQSKFWAYFSWFCKLSGSRSGGVYHERRRTQSDVVTNRKFLFRQCTSSLSLSLRTQGNHHKWIRRSAVIVKGVLDKSCARSWVMLAALGPVAWTTSVNRNKYTEQCCSHRIWDSFSFALIFVLLRRHTHSWTHSWAWLYFLKTILQIQ